MGSKQLITECRRPRSASFPSPGYVATSLLFLTACARTDTISLAALPACSDGPYLVHRAERPLEINDRANGYGTSCAIELARPASGTSGSIALRWSEEALHIALAARDNDLQAVETVRDGPVHSDDSLEVMFDTEHDGGDAMQADDYKFFANLLNTQRDSRGARWADPAWNTTFASEAVVEGTIGDDSDADVGYRIELLVSWEAWGIAAPTAGTMWGMSISLNDRISDGTCTQTAWPGPELANVPDSWGDMLFVDVE
jgi:hypothetical protein